MMNLKTYVYSGNATITYDFERLPEHARALRLFLSRLQKDHSEIYNDYLITLEKKLLALNSIPTADWETSNIPGLSDVIQDCSKLEKLYFWYAFQLLEIPLGYSAESIELSWTTLLKYVKYPFYHRIAALCDVMGRQKAIAYEKGYIDKKTYKQVEPNMDLDHLWNTDTSGQVLPTRNNQYRYNEGKITSRVDNCSWNEVKEPFNKPELSYQVCCYGDIAGFKARNPNLMFTTLAEGGPYCDGCWYDKRHVAEIEHPNPEFSENLVV